MSRTTAETPDFGLKSTLKKTLCLGQGRFKDSLLAGQGRAGQGAEGRGQRAEGRGQRAEGRGQRAEGRGQRAEGRGQRAEAGAGAGAGQGRRAGQGRAGQGPGGAGQGRAGQGRGGEGSPLAELCLDGGLGQSFYCTHRIRQLPGCASPKALRAYARCSGPAAHRVCFAAARRLYHLKRLALV